MTRLSDTLRIVTRIDRRLGCIKESDVYAYRNGATGALRPSPVSIIPSLDSVHSRGNRLVHPASVDMHELRRQAADVRGAY